MQGLLRIKHDETHILFVGILLLNAPAGLAQRGDWEVQSDVPCSGILSGPMASA